ncbi:MAG: 2-phospho-L-lactate guanylyltransferase [SAR202 cluster bacterium Io17-Chloro-G9]|nr:MAG: 2-phospho-L-lactate guanylyltransferase [SAR202 cluster bacterium Io17-Chloro-G9]
MLEQEESFIAIVPMKPLADSKTRLAQRFSPAQRGSLALGMLDHVISAIKDASISHVWVVGGDQQVRDMAEKFGSLWLEELGCGLNDTLGKAFDRAFQQDASALYVAGDLPFLKPGDLHSLTQASRRRKNVTLAPARRGGGTNAMLLPPGVAFRPQLGPSSFTKHLSQAAALEISVAICSSPGLGMDLDTTDDLDTYEHMEPGFLERLAVE